jgi:hypothetical protein
MNLKINQNLKFKNKEYKKDSIIEVEDVDNIPTDLFWRNRLKDSTIDNCVEIVTTQKKDKK